MRSTVVYILILISAITSPCVRAAVYYVAKTGDDGNDGASGTPWLTIQHAVDNAAASDEIRVASGTYTENIVVPYSTRNNLILKGGYQSGTWTWAPGDNPTVVEAANAASDVVQLRSVAVSVIGFTLRGGRYGVNCRGGDADGVYFISHCKIMDNADHGIRFQVDGGAKHAFRVLNCLIVNNGGNGIYFYIDNSTFESFLYCSTIADNGEGGYWSVQNSSRKTRTKNCIVSGNGGYGIRRSGGAAQNWLYDHVWNTCVYDHALNNLRGDATIDRLIIEADVFAGNPMFAGGGDYRLQNTSPAIAAGLDLSADEFMPVTDDIDGNPRVDWDLGCYESGYAPPVKESVTYVDASMPDDNGAGTSWETAKRWINSAAAITADGGTVYVAPGVYNETLLPTANVTIQGAGAELVEVTNIWYTAIFQATNATLAGVTLRGGAWHRVARFQRGGNTLRDSIVEKGTNTGVYVVAHNNYIENTLVRSNNIGVHVEANALITLDRCRIVNNNSHGMFGNQKGAISAVNTIFADNGGDGVYIYSDNSSYKSIVQFCTIAGNAGNGYRDSHYWHNTTYMTNNIISGNDGYGYQRLASHHRNNFISYSLVFDNALGDFEGGQIVLGDGMITNELPLFFRGYELDEFSPCVDSAVDMGVYVDITGLPRPQLDGFDMGAYEYVPPPGTILSFR